MTIKAIETRYNGCRFRSRLEARWAVFFDALGVPWEYEKEGFDLDGIRYLPDFWLPHMNMWAEVKGQSLMTDEWRKVIRLTYHTKTAALVLVGSIVSGMNITLVIGIPPKLDESFEIEMLRQLGIVEEQDLASIYDDVSWAECPVCTRLCIGSEHSTELFSIVCQYCSSGNAKIRARLNKHDPRFTDSLVAAYTNARSARFE